MYSVNFYILSLCLCLCLSLQLSSISDLDGVTQSTQYEPPNAVASAGTSSATGSSNRNAQPASSGAPPPTAQGAPPPEASGEPIPPPQPEPEAAQASKGRGGPLSLLSVSLSPPSLYIVSVLAFLYNNYYLFFNFTYM